MRLQDLTGQRFGRLTVIKRIESKRSPNGNQRTMWLCRCDCGKEVEKSSISLKSTEIPSCGCYTKEIVSKIRTHDLTGQRFGKLLVVRRSMEEPTWPTKWVCKCDCGNECVVFAGNLKKEGHTTSCGCVRDALRKKLKVTHGYTNTRIYSVYGKIKDRCYNPNMPCYHRYGGRGITMCDEWKDNPASFCEWAYANGYREDAKYGECTIERMDNNKGYSPENCKIADEKEQANNRRTNIWIEFNGMRKTLAQWRDFLGISQSQAHYHLIEKGRSIQYLIDNGIAKNNVISI